MKSKKFKVENYKDNEVRLTLRLPEELHNEISLYANKHNISLNSLIVSCIKYAMDNKEE